MVGEYDVIATKHLICFPRARGVFERASCFTLYGYLFPGTYLGGIDSGPNCFIDDLDIISEWQQIQEFVSQSAGR